MKTPMRCVVALLAGLAGACLQAGPVVVESGVFVVDRTAPEAPALMAPGAGANVGVLPVFLQASASDAQSGVADYLFEYGDRTSVWLPQSFLLVNSLTPGPWAWRCKARDRAGNESAWSAWSDFMLSANGAVTDLDGDELPDAWERTWFGRLDYSSGFQDSDGDGVTDAEEYAAGTNPLEFSTNLVAGWNLLVFPVKMSAASVAALHTAGAGTFWTWTGTRYLLSGAPEAYQAFWVYAGRAASGVRVTGTVPTSGLVTLAPGWALVGSGFAAHTPLAEANPILASWRWTDGHYEALSLIHISEPTRPY